MRGCENEGSKAVTGRWLFSWIGLVTIFWPVAVGFQIGINLDDYKRTRLTFLNHIEHFGHEGMAIMSELKTILLCTSPRTTGL